MIFAFFFTSPIFFIQLSQPLISDGGGTLEFNTVLGIPAFHEFLGYVTIMFSILGIFILGISILGVLNPP